MRPDLALPLLFMCRRKFVKDVGLLCWCLMLVVGYAIECTMYVGGSQCKCRFLNFCRVYWKAYYERLTKEVDKRLGHV